MAWPNLPLKSWGHFQRILEGIPKKDLGKVMYIFRGQADAKWRLDPSLTRELRRINADITSLEAEEIEVALLDYFVASFGQHFPQNVADSRTNPVLRWSLMQHHYAPTRLLDWTANLLVAAYFASESHWDSDGAIWIVHAKFLNDEVNRRFHGEVQNYEMLRSGQAQPVVQLYFEDRAHDRIAAQDGLFTFSHQVFGDQEEIIGRVCQTESEQLKDQCTVFCKVIVPRDLKPVFLGELSHRGVTANSLFPGSDGYGRSLLELARMMAHHRMSIRSSLNNGET